MLQKWSCIVVRHMMLIRPITGDVNFAFCFFFFFSNWSIVNIQKSTYTQWTFTVWTHLWNYNPDQQKYFPAPSNPPYPHQAPTSPKEPPSWLLTVQITFVWFWISNKWNKSFQKSPYFLAIFAHIMFVRFSESTFILINAMLPIINLRWKLKKT